MVTYCVTCKFSGLKREFLQTIEIRRTLTPCPLVTLRRSWVRFLSGTQIFSLSHARVMLFNSPFTFHHRACKFSNCHKIFVFRLMSPEFSIIPYVLPLFLSPICQELPFVMTGANGKRFLDARESLLPSIKTF